MVFRLALAGSPLSPHLPSAAHPKGKAGARTGRSAMDNGRDECGARHAASELLPPTVQSHGPARRHAPVRVGPAQYSRRVRVKEVEQWSTPAAQAKPWLLAAQSMDLYNFQVHHMRTLHSARTLESGNRTFQQKTVEKEKVGHMMFQKTNCSGVNSLHVIRKYNSFFMCH